MPSTVIGITRFALPAIIVPRNRLKCLVLSTRLLNSLCLTPYTLLGMSISLPLTSNTGPL